MDIGLVTYVPLASGTVSNNLSSSKSQFFYSMHKPFNVQCHNFVQCFEQSYIYHFGARLFTGLNKISTLRINGSISYPGHFVSSRYEDDETKSLSVLILRKKCPGYEVVKG